MTCNSETTYTTLFTWKIEEFSTVASLEGPNSALFSKDFLVNGTNAMVCLIFCPNNSISNDHCSLFFQGKVPDESVQIPVTYKLCIANMIGGVISEKNAIMHSLNNISVSGSEDFIPKFDLYPPGNFIQDNALFIACEVTYTASTPISESVSKEIFSTDVIEGCTILCGEIDILVPKHLLAFRFNYFKSIFKSQTAEAKSGRIQIEETESSILEEFYHFIHCGQLSSNCKHVEELYALADRYQSDLLKTECELFCLNSTNEKDLQSCFKIGSTYGIEELMEYAFDQSKKDFNKSA